MTKQAGRLCFYLAVFGCLLAATLGGVNAVMGSTPEWRLGGVTVALAAAMSLGLLAGNAK